MKSNTNLSEQEIIEISQKIRDAPEDYFEGLPAS